MIPSLQLSIHKQLTKKRPKGNQQCMKTHEVIQIEDSEEERRVRKQFTPQSFQILRTINPQDYQSYSPQDFNFLEVPVVQLTEEFLNDPYKLIDDLYEKQYHKIGIVKLVSCNLSQDVWNTLTERLGDKKLITRRQNLNELTLAKPFEQNLNGYTITEYCQMAQDFDLNYKTQVPQQCQDKLRQNELEFWSIVDKPELYDQVEVEYAADLLACKYATAFQDKAFNFNLNKVNKLRDSMFQILTKKQEMSGISVPWLYFGMKFACFCWHCEDLYLSSLNYMHSGAPKTWYAIPPSYSEKFYEVFNSKHDLKKNPRLLYDITTMISPVELANANIKVLRTDQKPGELILTLGGTYHSGFSHGLNCSEAVNIAPTQWIDEYPKAVEQYRRNGNYKKVSFPLEWLIIKILKNFESTRFSKYHLLQILQHFQKIREVESNFKKIVTKLYKNLTIIEFTNSEERYDKNICKICTDYIYLSFLYCNKCLIKGCLHHQSICLCIKNKMSLYQRYADETLQDLEDSIIKFTQQL